MPDETTVPMEGEELTAAPAPEAPAEETPEEAPAA
jgi:hypothetical protein